MDAGISCIAPPTLTEVGRNVVELSPTDCHLVAVRRINRDRALVGSIADDVIPICINVYLVADENAMRGDHSR